MLLAALLLTQAAPQAIDSAVDAERAFNRMAQTQGQWTAFRAFAAPDAVLFTPQPEKAHDVLPAKNPPISVQWWPAESYVSCDGKLAVNTGPWVRPKSAGYFTTVWVKQPDGSWKWLLDHGDDLAAPRPLPDKPRVHRAACAGTPVAVSAIYHREGPSDIGSSSDGTLSWRWHVAANGARSFEAFLWDGKAMAPVVSDVVEVPPSK